MNDKCDGCRHNIPTDHDFCYMFDKEPEHLPCGQHDKYKAMRNAVGRIIAKNPFLLHLLVSESIMMTQERMALINARYPMNNTIRKEGMHEQ